MQVTVESTIRSSAARVWQALSEPDEIVQWNSGHPDWHTPRASNDLREGGCFNYRMEAKDGSAGFDFEGTYTRVIPEERIEYALEDGRKVSITMRPVADGVTLRETFEAEDELSAEQQRQGWQAILDNLARHVEAHPG